MGTCTTASFLVLPKRPSAHDLCSVMNSANQTDRPRTRRSVGTTPSSLPTVTTRETAASESSAAAARDGPRPTRQAATQARNPDSPSTFLNTAVISKLMAIMRACFPLRKIRSVKRQGRPYGGGRQERSFFNIYMLRSLHTLFY